jgi:hypothetical protein
VDATVDGMLGGFGSLSDVDVKESVQFLGYIRSMKGLTPFEFEYAIGTLSGVV